MKETSQTIQHPRLGEIVYTENIWTGKKSITANGVPAQAITKKDFLINGEKATVKGNTYSGMSLVIGDEALPPYCCSRTDCRTIFRRALLRRRAAV